MSDPTPMSLWQHTNGIRYYVVAIANDNPNPDYPKTVVYKNAKTGTYWARLLSDWHRSFEEVEA